MHQLQPSLVSLSHTSAALALLLALLPPAHTPALVPASLVALSCMHQLGLVLRLRPAVSP